MRDFEEAEARSVGSHSEKEKQMEAEASQDGLHFETKRSLGNCRATMMLLGAIRRSKGSGTSATDMP